MFYTLKLNKILFCTLSKDKILKETHNKENVHVLEFLWVSMVVGLSSQI